MTDKSGIRNEEVVPTVLSGYLLIIIPLSDFFNTTKMLSH